MCESVHPDVANNLFGHGTCFFSVTHCRAFELQGIEGQGIIKKWLLNSSLEMRASLSTCMFS